MCLPPDWPYVPASPVQLATVLVPADALDRVAQDGTLEHRRPVQVYRLLGRVHPRLEGASHHQVHLKREERKSERIRQSLTRHDRQTSIRCDPTVLFMMQTYIPESSTSRRLKTSTSRWYLTLGDGSTWRSDPPGDSNLNHVDSGTGNPSETQGKRALSPTHRVTAVRSDDEEERGSMSRGGTAPSGSKNEFSGIVNEL